MFESRLCVPGRRLVCRAAGRIYRRDHTFGRHCVSLILSGEYRPGAGSRPCASRQSRTAI